jgi:cell wall-associated NlpC family hydrolase
VASQPLNFGELLAGGILLTMGISGASVREVIAGKGGKIRPLAAGGATAATTAHDTAFTSGVTGASPSAERLVKLAESQKGVKEGTAQAERIAAAAGISSAQAWCAAFITWALKRSGVKNLPSSPAAVSSWESWSGGEHISGGLANARAGDLIAFNGEHIGLYLGGGRMISGNWSNEVAIDSVSAETEPITAIIRVKGLYSEAVKSLGRGAAESLGWKGKVRV